MDKNSKRYKEFRRNANERNKRYYSKPEVKERKRIYREVYNKKNKDKISEYGHKLRARPEYQIRVKKWREENKEHLKLKGKEWRLKNKERKKQHDREYSKKIWKNPITRQKEIERQKKFRIDHSDLVKSSRKKYNHSKKGVLQSTKTNHKRLSWIHNSQFDLTSKQIKDIYDRDKVCVYCSNSTNLNLDHIIPLSKGGEGTFYNFVVACKKCNCSKGKKDVIEWCHLEKKKVPEIIIKNLERLNAE